MSSNFYAAVTIILWGAMPALTKNLLNALPNFETLAVSSLFAFMFLFAVNRRAGTLKKLSADEILTAAALGFVGLFMYSAFFYYGLARMTSQEACILNYLWPLMIVLFSCPILGEELTRRTVDATKTFGGRLEFRRSGRRNVRRHVGTADGGKIFRRGELHNCGGVLRIVLGAE